jgi:twitching motility protein PilT
MAIFSSSVQDALKKLAKGTFSSSNERDEMLTAVLQADNLKPRDVVWMLFRPDRAIRETCTKVLQKHPSVETADLILGGCKGKADSVIRPAAATLFSLKITGLEERLNQLLAAKDEETKEIVRKVILQAPPIRALETLLWKLAEEAKPEARAQYFDRLSAYPMSRGSFQKWMRLARDEIAAVREKALLVLADNAAAESINTLVDSLPRASYSTQQHLIQALTNLAKGKGPEFADKILPLIAAGDAGTRSAVLKILLGMENRRELVRRYLVFSKTLAGWARDRALDSMDEFGKDLIDPTVELLSDEDEDVRAAALVVAGSFEDPRIVPATIGLLKDPDWWLRITAAETLGRLKDPRALEPLIEALKDPEARWAAVEALGRIADSRALPALGQLLKDPAAEVRIEVLVALRNFKHPKILEVVRKVASTDPDRIVRGRALEIAEAVARRDHTEIADADGLRRTALQLQVSKDEPRINAMLMATRNQEASDLHISVSQPPVTRLASDLVPARGEPFTAEQTEKMLKEILTEEQWRRLEKEKQVDFCYFIPKAGRYRANVFLDQKGYNAVFRVIPEQPPTTAEVGLPPHLVEIADYHQGLVLICGPAGSGKSTTLAALVNLFNETRYDHILTLEDPVEFVHPFKNCLINQREVNTHTDSFARALRAALREDPDVIVIGDLRDNETVSLALTAAETGHIVLGTLNSTSAYKAVDRIISSFPSSEQPQIRAAMAESLKFVVAQRLLPADGERRQVACFEVLRGTFSIANLIREQKTFQIPSMMKIGRTQGMQTFDDALKDLVREKKVSPETAYMAAEVKQDFEDLVSAEFLENQTFL